MDDITLPNPQQFYADVWEAARMVPRGFVMTYGQIAEIVGPPTDISAEEYRAAGPRWVGSAMAACPADVPWQRVINSQGKISKRPGAERQRHLLEQEGVRFVKDKIDLNVYQWHGPDHTPPPRQTSLFDQF